MTTFKNRPNTALVILDRQNGVVSGTHQRDTVVANVASLVEKARAGQVPVVWVQHSDDRLPRDNEDWRYVPEMARDDAEPLVEKNFADAFESITLETVLSERGVGREVVADAQTDECARRPHDRGPDRVGAPQPDKVIAHTNLYWTYHRAPGRTAVTVEAKNDFGPAP